MQVQTEVGAAGCEAGRVRIECSTTSCWIAATTCAVSGKHAFFVTGRICARKARAVTRSHATTQGDGSEGNG